MEFLKDGSLQDALTVYINTAMSAISSCSEQLQLDEIKNNGMKVVLSLINQFWFWSIILFIIIAVIILRRKRHTKVKKSFYTELTNKESSFKNPYKLNIYDLCKTAYHPGHTEAVIDLIERLHYDINAPIPSNGLTIFSCACLSGSKKLILYLLLRGADLMSVTKDGDSPLYLATYAALNSPQTDVTALDLLITYGCDVNKKNNKGYAPLHRAASKGNYKVVQCLLRHGARVNMPTKSGIYPIDCATNSGHTEIAKILAFKVNNPHVWDVVEPHTPPSIKMGLRTPVRPNFLQSPMYKRSFNCQKIRHM